MNSEAEDADLEANTQLSPRFDGGPPSRTHSGPIGDAVPVKLRAGDGAVYINTILHWSDRLSPDPVCTCPFVPSRRGVLRGRGSNYSASIMRRTIHIAFRAFGAGYWPVQHTPTYGTAILDRLPERLIPQFQQFFELLSAEEGVIKEALLAVGKRDSAAFVDALDRLSPNRATQVPILARLKVYAEKQYREGDQGHSR